MFADVRIGSFDLIGCKNVGIYDVWLQSLELDLVSYIGTFTTLDDFRRFLRQDIEIYISEIRTQSAQSDAEISARQPKWGYGDD